MEHPHLLRCLNMQFHVKIEGGRAGDKKNKFITITKFIRKCAKLHVHPSYTLGYKDITTANNWEDPNNSANLNNLIKSIQRGKRLVARDVIVTLGKLILRIKHCHNRIPTKFPAIHPCAGFSRTIHIRVLQKHLSNSR